MSGDGEGDYPGWCDACRDWVDAYWSPDHDNFYCSRCRGGMGATFYKRYRRSVPVKPDTRVRYVYLVLSHNEFFYIVPEPGGRRYRQVEDPKDAHWFTDRSVAEEWARNLRGSVRTFVATPEGLSMGKGVVSGKGGGR